ncbi:MAG: AAA family ATPase [Patescibacteria group bacterium]|nr:AAA family ATPase [Patescibacteria group bacterium]
MAMKKLTKTTASAGPMPTLMPGHSIAIPAQEAANPAWSDAGILEAIPPHVCALIGDSGTGKSTLAAKFPKTSERPQLVFAFDPPGKMYPYKEGYDVVPIEDEYYASVGMKAESVLDADGREVRRIEYFVDPNPDLPRAAANVEQRLVGFDATAHEWSSVVFDSMTFYQYAALRRARYQFPMPPGKEQGQNLAWYSQVKQDVERVVKSQAVWWPTNVIFIFHTNEEKAEFASETLRGLLAVGKLPAELPPGFSEMYRLYVQRVGDNHVHRVQTKHDGLWMATSIIAHAPSPCEADFRALWANFLATRTPK